MAEDGGAAYRIKGHTLLETVEETRIRYPIEMNQIYNRFKNTP